MNFYQVGWLTKNCLQAGCCTHLKLMMNGCAVLSNTLFSAIVCSTCTSYNCPPLFYFLTTSLRLTITSFRKIFIAYNF